MALTHITLRDFVIVQALELDLQSGFSVLTGETGAGKSILIDAVQLALGARAESGVVREGAQRCEVCAEFEPTPAIQTWLEEAGFETSSELLLRRTVDNAGKSRAWINGSPATAAQLRELGEQLIDIHGQHAWQSLTRPDAVRGLLDAYAGIDAKPLKQLGRPGGRPCKIWPTRSKRKAHWPTNASDWRGKLASWKSSTRSMANGKT